VASGFPAFVLDAAFLALPALYHAGKGRNPAKELGFEVPPYDRLVKQTVTLFFALLATSLLLSLVLGLLQANDLHKVGEQVGKIQQAQPWMLYYLLSVRVVAEEGFFRGFLARKFGVWPSSGLFALVHVFYGSVAEVLGAFVLGGLLAKAYKTNHSLIPNIFAHALYNLAILKVFFWV